MAALNRGVILGVMLCAWLCASRALAAPERLGDWVPDATPDQSGAWSFSYNRMQLDLEGGLTAERTAHDFYKLRYTFNPKTAVTLRYTHDDLAGGSGLLMPLFDGMDSAVSYEVDLGMNLVNIAAIPADPSKNQPFAAGSSFGLGIAGTRFTLEQGAVTQDETMLKAYLIYSTDLTEDLRAHTVFSSGRLSGDAQSGSANRVGAGLDYALSSGEHPLTLMANGIIDIYNFREPSFNTSRVSRFDVGLRYRVARSWYANIGWATLNDSESDKSGSGLFAGINFVAEPPPPAPPCPVAPPEPPPAEVAPPPPLTSQAPSGETMAQAPVADTQPQFMQQPPLMDVALPKGGAKQAASANTSEEARAAYLGNLGSADQSVSNSIQDAQLPQPAPEPPVEAAAEAMPAAQLPGSQAADTASSSAEELDAAPSADGADDGVAIPMFPLDPPQPTPAGAVMVRAGQPLRLASAAGTKYDAIARPPAGPYTPGTALDATGAGEAQAPAADGAEVASAADAAPEAAPSPAPPADDAATLPAPVLGSGVIAISQSGVVSGHLEEPAPEGQGGDGQSDPAEKSDTAGKSNESGKTDPDGSDDGAK